MVEVQHRPVVVWGHPDDVGRQQGAAGQREPLVRADSLQAGRLRLARRLGQAGQVEQRDVEHELRRDALDRLRVRGGDRGAQALVPGHHPVERLAE